MLEQLGLIFGCCECVCWVSRYRYNDYYCATIYSGATVSQLRCAVGNKERCEHGGVLHHCEALQNEAPNK